MFCEPRSSRHIPFNEHLSLTTWAQSFVTYTLGNQSIYGNVGALAPAERNWWTRRERQTLCQCTWVLLRWWIMWCSYCEEISTVHLMNSIRLIINSSPTLLILSHNRSMTSTKALKVWRCHTIGVWRQNIVEFCGNPPHTHTHTNKIGEGVGDLTSHNRNMTSTQALKVWRHVMAIGWEDMMEGLSFILCSINLPWFPRSFIMTLVYVMSQKTTLASPTMSLKIRFNAFHRG